MQAQNVFEFLFTRAVDRKILFRARSIAFFIFCLTPLFLNLAISPLASPVRFDPADPTSVESIRRHEQYRRAFPASHPEAGAATANPGQIVIPHGAVAYTAWLTWGGMMVFLLLQAYGTLIARRVKSSNGWTVLFLIAPVLVLFVSFVFLMRGSWKAHLHIYEDSFLLFSTYPLAMVLALAGLAVVIQTWCERRFSQLEIF